MCYVTVPGVGETNETSQEHRPGPDYKALGSAAAADVRSFSNQNLLGSMFWAVDAPAIESPRFIYIYID